eukprot:TRINITY_DN28236_c0_g1_i1.p1 TRINITY_DN28236_c0_g1~~TRINITY_DN28236_c0_g1_i1.p1  ORF type:complete len:116 (+),score=15.46 TRINITY_DN28236_c0_g1_i1:106-453(+)
MSSVENETQRPITALILGRNDPFFKPCRWIIEVSEGCSTHIVVKRYRDFIAFDREIRHLYASLPDLPPRSFFRRMVSRRFMDARRAGLAAYSKAVLAGDRVASNPNVRRFFEIAP